MELKSLQVRTYEDIRRNVAVATFFFVLSAASFVGNTHTGFTTFLGKFIPFPSSLISIGGSIAYVELAGLAAALEYAFRIHDKMARVLHLRTWFDIKYILVPLSQECQCSRVVYSDLATIKSLSDLLDVAFYTYTSSERPIIDPHLVINALDCWRWLWTFLEGSTVCFVTGLVLLVLRSFAAAGGWFGGALVLAFFCYAGLGACKSYTNREIAAIKRLLDTDRSSDKARIADAFNHALQR